MFPFTYLYIYFLVPFEKINYRLFGFYLKKNYEPKNINQKIFIYELNFVLFDSYSQKKMKTNN